MNDAQLELAYQKADELLCPLFFVDGLPGGVDPGTHSKQYMFGKRYEVGGVALFKELECQRAWVGLMGNIKRKRTQPYQLSYPEPMEPARRS